MALSSAVKSLKEASALFKRDNRTADAATSTQRVVATTTSDNNVVVVDTDKRSNTTDSSDVSPPSLSASFPSLASFKDQRAFEHDRQRVKRLEEYTRAQEAKALKGGLSSKPTTILTSSPEGRKKSSASGGGTTNSIRSTRSTRKKTRRLPGSGFDHDTPDDKADEACVDGVVQNVREEFEGGRVLPSGRKDSSSESGTGTEYTEVKLVDLIKPTSSIRKPRKNKDTDFELIPAVRSVIVLDELAFMHDAPLPRDLEQEWQHVYHSESGDDSDASVSTLSYANVLTGRGRSR
ncbi:hypothetical protein F5880DRAFT_1331728 [Lentinula raphanica]|nr:hypothetical protein F5880DRAFT_1331728 [Lentinula raphanica]